MNDILFLFMFYRYDVPVRGRKINWLKAGMLESDLVLTVSPNYASELISGEDRGVELDTIVKKTGITGISNGMDVQEWDPSSDKYLEVKYDSSTVSFIFYDIYLVYLHLKSNILQFPMIASIC